MESPIKQAYTDYQEKLQAFAQTIKSQVRANASLKAVQAALEITAAMYYQRLKYPQNIPKQEIDALTKLVQNDAIAQRYEETLEFGQQLSETIAESLRNAEITVTFLCKKLGINTSSYHRKQKDPRLWDKAEIERIAQVIEIIKRL
ncbi:hypothetical protein [Larkinella sp. C7]|uniref:hypothetical protein n=1 Tax=Larkinella sp. C7 TaxID=2576607 RepID=UPI00111143CC|nr:hypothetical protein [Larkinella sp. C7]